MPCDAWGVGCRVDPWGMSDLPEDLLREKYYGMKARTGVGDYIGTGMSHHRDPWGLGQGIIPAAAGQSNIIMLALTVIGAIWLFQQLRK